MPCCGKGVRMKTVNLIAPVKNFPYPVRIIAPSGAVYSVGGVTVEVSAREVDVQFLLNRGCIYADQAQPSQGPGTGGSGPEGVLGSSTDNAGQDILADAEGSARGETDQAGVPPRRGGRRKSSSGD